jgi:hypothetical protein
MKKSIIGVLGAAALVGAAVMSTSAASAATNPDTGVTFAVTGGDLTINAPTGVALVPGGTDTGLPGTNVVGLMGDTTVTDNRALDGAIWNATVSESDFTTGTGTSAETIAASYATYAPGTVTTTGTVTTSEADSATLSNGAQDVVGGSLIEGDNTATWDATVVVAIPDTAVVGAYTGLLVSSVS